MKRLGWSKVAALTQDGQKYSDYMPALQDEFQANHFEFMENRKFPEEVSDVEKMKEVRAKHKHFSLNILRTNCIFLSSIWRA